MMETNSNTTYHNDAVFTYSDKILTVTHKENKFSPIQRIIDDSANTLFPLFKTETNNVSVMIDTVFAYYFIVDKEGKVMHQPLRNYEDAVEKAMTYDASYPEWVAAQTVKGLSKKQFVKDVRENKLKAKKTYTVMKGRTCDTQFYPLMKTKGRGSIDIVRDNKAASIFYLDSFPSNLMVYTGDKLSIYSPGYRIWNEKEKEVATQWEKMRDRKEEFVDLISDGSTQFYRKRDFFSKNGCEHLIGQTYKGLVRDCNVRMNLELVYDICKTTE